MNLLAFDTSTELMSVAVQCRAGRGPVASERLWQHSGAGGAHTSATLLPIIQSLMAQAQLAFTDLDAVAFGMGPGSFTGLRTACSVAQGLAFGAKLKVLPLDTLLALAEEARFQQAPALARWQVTALLDARMDELYAADYAYDDGGWQQLQSDRLLRPDELICEPGRALAGNVFAAYGARLRSGMAICIDAWPTASAMLRLAPALLAKGQAVPAGQALPLYIRDKVAQTTAERAAGKRVP